MDWFYDFVTSGIVVNLQLLTLRNPFLDSVFTLITFLGNEEFYLIVAPLLYWIVHKSFGRKVIYLLLISNYINAFFKNWFDLPRPFQLDSSLAPSFAQGGYGLPSGHSQLSVALWGYAAWAVRKAARWVLPAAAVVMLLVMFSRMYLGVHFPADVGVGATLGLITLYLWLRYEPRLAELPPKLTEQMVLIGSVLLAVLLFFLMPDDQIGYPAEDAATTAGLMLGLNIGFFYEARNTRFVVAGVWWQYLARYILGMIMVVIFWAGLRAVFDPFAANHWSALLLRLIRYLLAGVTLSWWAPALFVKLGLAGQESRA